MILPSVADPASRKWDVGAQRDALAGTQPVRQLERSVANRFSERNLIVRERLTLRHAHSEGAGQKGLIAYALA